MTVRCPSCGANLKVNLERLGGRPSAKCPSCHASVPLTQHSAGAAETVMATLIVTCQACKTRLKAPAARAGARSTCPKCHAPVLIEAAPVAATPGAASPGAAGAGAAGRGNVLVAAAAGSDSQDEASSASTRRIDSRMIGMMSSGKPMDASAGVDLEAFLKTGAATPSSTPGDAPASQPKSDPGSVAPLLNPPVEKLENIAREIRRTAETLTQGPEPAAPAKQGPAERHRPDAAAPVSAGRRPARTPLEHLEEPAPHATPSAAPGQEGLLFPSWRGITSGALAGLLVGAAQTAIGMTPYRWLLPPMPSAAGFLALPELAARILLVALLGAIAGFIAGAAGSPRRSDRPLNLMRCSGTGLLMGLACGLVGGLIAGTGVQVWPIANWMRDLLLVGLLTPALHRLLPDPRT